MKMQPILTLICLIFLAYVPAFALIISLAPTDAKDAAPPKAPVTIPRPG